MLNRKIFQIFRSHYCKITFLAAFFGAYFLVPQKVFSSPYLPLGVLFMILTAFLFTCIVRDIKEKTLAARSKGTSLLGIVATILGLGAMQTCVVSAPLCGASIGGGILALILPNFALGFFQEYGSYLLLFALFVQVFTLYFINCFQAGTEQG